MVRLCAAVMCRSTPPACSSASTIVFSGSEFRIFVTSNAALIEVIPCPDPAATAKRHTISVEQLQFDRRVGGNLDMKRTVRCDGNLAQDPARRWLDAGRKRSVGVLFSRRPATWARLRSPAASSPSRRHRGRILQVVRIDIQTVHLPVRIRVVNRTRPSIRLLPRRNRLRLKKVVFWFLASRSI